MPVVEFKPAFPSAQRLSPVLQANNLIAKSPLFPPVPNRRSPPPARSLPMWRHLGSRTEAQQVRAYRTVFCCVLQWRTRFAPLHQLKPPSSRNVQYIAPIFTGCPSNDTRLVEIRQTEAAAHVQLLSYSKQVLHLFDY